MKEKAEAYSFHRYVEDSGAPDRSRIFIRQGDSARERLDEHLDPTLLRILDNQPQEVRDVANKHMYERNRGKGCPECLEKYRPKKEKQIDLPLDPE